VGRAKDTCAGYVHNLAEEVVTVEVR
jgi:hypothetical protein